MVVPFVDQHCCHRRHDSRLILQLPHDPEEIPRQCQGHSLGDLACFLILLRLLIIELEDAAIGFHYESGIEHHAIPFEMNFRQ